MGSIHKDKKTQNIAKHIYNENYFKILDTPEKAYFLGFIAADGTINKEKHLIINIKDSDKEVLINFCNEIGCSEDAIHKHSYNTKVKTYSYNYTEAYIKLSRKTIGETLEKYNIIKNKTYKNPNFLKNIPDKYKAAWITGYIDGDGFVSKRGYIGFIINKATGVEICKFLSKKGIYLSGIQLKNKNDTIELRANNYMSNLLLSILYVYSNKYHLTRKLNGISSVLFLYGYNVHKNLNISHEKTIPDILVEHKNNKQINYTGKYKAKMCKICGKKIYKGANYCIDCWNKKKSENIPERDILKNDIRNNSFVSLSKKYSVSDNAIRKWCKKYNLPYKRNEIKKYNDKEWELI